MYQFDVKDATLKCVEWIKEFFEKNGPTCNAVLGISGGKDSSVAAALCVEALGKDRVIGVLLPNGEQSDIDCSYKLCNHLGIKYHVINIEKSFNGIVEEMKKALDVSEQSIINLPPRLRMSTIYAVSQSLNGRVVNTCNLSEDWVGYSTRYGDSVGDFSPLSHFTVTEVKQIGKYLGLPIDLVDKVPSDGLSGKSDEDKLGVTYKAITNYMEGKEVSEKDKKTIERLHKNTHHKFNIPTYRREEN
jgi:NAD+ synthase